MKEQTNISHKSPKTHEWCSEKLQKEYWGCDMWNMTCWKCGFSDVIMNDVFLKWQYCDKVLDD